MNATVSRSYAYCDRLARREAGNFYHAFRVLPEDQRRAMTALYAFLRISDDLADGQDDGDAKRAALADWRRRYERIYDGHYSHALHAAFHDTLCRHAIPRTYLEAVLDGVAMDLDVRRYETFADLYPYCYRVASAVGLACIRIWGCRAPEADQYAEQAGIAFQLTNILRDLAEDAARDRIYLPIEELGRFAYTEGQLLRGESTPAFTNLMRFQVARARDYYDAARPLTRLLDPPGRAVFQVMTRTYRGILDAIEAREYDVFSGRVRLPAWRKAGYALQALPVRWGWTLGSAKC